MKRIIVIFLLVISIQFLCAADSLRTRTELEAIFADNEAGNISAQDLRDFVYSTWIRADSVDFDKAEFDNIGEFFTWGGSGDINNSGIVNAADLSYYLDYFTGADTLSIAEYQKADINGDGFVDLFDFAMFFPLAVAVTETPISNADKLEAWQNASQLLMCASDGGIQTKSLSFGTEFYSAYATIDSTDAYKLDVITTYCDSITTGTDVIYFYKDGKRADLDFVTP